MEKTIKPVPAFRGKLDVALWEKKDKNGNSYFTIKIANICNVFANIQKEE